MDASVGQFERLADALDAGDPSPVTVADARAALEIVTAAYWSAATHDDVVLPVGPEHPAYAGPPFPTR